MVPSERRAKPCHSNHPGCAEEVLEYCATRIANAANASARQRCPHMSKQTDSSPMRRPGICGRSDIHVTPSRYRQSERGNRTVNEQTSTPILTAQFSKALVYAEHKHHSQVRKGGDIPYVGHLLSVAGLVINDGGSETQAIAALLHDAVEDQGGPQTLQEIRANFGEDVARIVDECSDADEEPKPPWLDRKRTYINHLADVGDD